MRKVSTAEKMKRDQNLIRKRFQRKCARLGLTPKSWDEAQPTDICAYCIDEYSIGIAKRALDPILASTDILFLNESDYDSYYIEN